MEVLDGGGDGGGSGCGAGGGGGAGVGVSALPASVAKAVAANTVASKLWVVCPGSDLGRAVCHPPQPQSGDKCHKASVVTVRVSSCSCDCGYFQVTGVPCQHAIAVVQAVGGGVATSNFVHPALTTAAMHAAYKAAGEAPQMHLVDLPRDDLLGPAVASVDEGHARDEV